MADLMKYLPPYYDENTEMTGLMEAENPEIDELDIALLQVRNNQFILTADDKRIRQWERLLRIRPDLAAQNLNYRKAVVILRLSTRMPLTYRWLEEKLTELVGKGHYVINLDHANYWLHIRLSNDVLGLIGELQHYLREKVPANLGLALEEIFKTWGEVLNNNYLTWGPVCKESNWGDLLGATWEGLWNRTWYDIRNMQVQQRGVHGGKVWWKIMARTWMAYQRTTWAELMAANTWQDVKNYEWEVEE